MIYKSSIKLYLNKILKENIKMNRKELMSKIITAVVAGDVLLS